MKTLLLSAQKGGAGKTALARNLSAAAAADGKRVLLIDLDPQGTSRRWLSRREADDLTMLDNDPEPSDLDRVLKGASSHFDLAVIDTPPAVPDWLTGAMKLSDLVLIPVKPSTDDLDAVGATIGAANRAGASFAFCLSMTKPRASLTDAVARALAQHGRVAPVNVGNRVVFEEIGGSGLSVFDTRDTKAQDEIRELWQYTKGIMQ
jgi:chromosome partitioning protein